MKLSRVLLIALGAACLGVGTAAGQRTPDSGPAGRASERVRPERDPGRDRLREFPSRSLDLRTQSPRPTRESIGPRLGLSPVQRSEVTSLLQQERASLDAVKRNSSLTRREKRTKSEEITKTYAERRRALLSEEQQARADDARAKARTPIQPLPEAPPVDSPED